MPILPALLWAMITTAAVAQVPPATAADPITFASAADIEGLIARARATIKPGQPSVIEPVVRLAPYRAVLEYRVAATPANTHVNDNELVYVLRGGGTVVIGGTLVGGKTVGANIIGTAIQGGAARHLVAGDVLLIPQDTPHWFNQIDGTMVMLSMHLPQPAR